MEVVVAPEPMDYEIRGMYRFATLREGAGLAEAVRDQWPVNPRLLMIAAEPESDTYTENLAMDLATALVKADLSVGELRVLQRETADVAAQLVAGADVIVLADGEGKDADAQREAFFGELDMPALLEGVKEGALVIALSEAARDAIRSPCCWVISDRRGFLLPRLAVAQRRVPGKIQALSIVRDDFVPLRHWAGNCAADTSS